MGATEEVALIILSGLEINTAGVSGDTDNPADLTASVNVLGIMANASGNVRLGEKLVPVRVKYLYAFLLVCASLF